MVETLSAADEDEFAALVEEHSNGIEERGGRQLWSATEQIQSDTQFLDPLVLLVEPWLMQENLGKRRPVLVGTVEHDDESKGAILFDDLYALDISIFENAVWDDESVILCDIMEKVDISDENDYIDDPQMMWIPRSQLTAIER